MGCSDTPASFEQALAAGEGAFADLEGIVFTHHHPDHYDRDAVGRLLARRPDLNVLDEVGPRTFVAGGMVVRTVPDAHDGDIFRDVPHQSLVISTGEEEIFVAGDSFLDEGVADRVLDLLEGEVSCAFVNPYQILEKEGLAFLRKVAPARILVYHVPFPEDDVYHYGDIQRDAIRRFSEPGLPMPEPVPQMAWVPDDVHARGGGTR